MSDGPEIEEIRRFEGGKRRPAQANAVADRFELRKYARELLMEDSQAVVEASMRAFGLEENTPAWRNALRVWRDHKHGQR